jgi:hypothetical protein
MVQSDVRTPVAEPLLAQQVRGNRKNEGVAPLAAQVAALGYEADHLLTRKHGNERTSLDNWERLLIPPTGHGAAKAYGARPGVSCGYLSNF